ncbi:MAG: NAD(P)/FAD-dependent oxidoreductase, partial [Solirubrobacteraceae bacterium]
MSVASRTFDVAIIGGGPAGIAAAVSASASGARVAMIDEGSAPGGQIWRDKLGTPASGAARRWKERLASSSASVLSSTSIVDASRTDRGFRIAAQQGADALTIEAATLIIATGARERFLPFPGWTLPNVVGVGGAQALLKTGMSVRGRRVVLAGSGPLLLPVAASLAGAGAKLALVAEQTTLNALAGYSLSLWRTPAMLVQAARLRAAFIGTRYATNTWVTRASGEDRVRSVEVSNGRSTREIECDLLCTAFG